MTRLKLKYQYVPLFIGLFLLIPAFTIIVLANKSLEKVDDTIYVNESIIEDTIPVINTTKKIINPYTDSSVTVGKSYYDYKADEEKQINSITVHDDTYMQNTGIDYVCDNEFDVIAVLEGTVITVKEDETVGKIIEIKHDDGNVTIYQSLSEINVKKGDVVSQGQVIGKSGTNNLDKDLGNHLHFEVYNNGQSINPENYLNTEVKNEKEN